MTFSCGLTGAAARILSAPSSKAAIRAILIFRWRAGEASQQDLFAIFVPSPRMPVATDAAAVAAPSQGAGGDALPTSRPGNESCPRYRAQHGRSPPSHRAGISGSRSHLPGRRRYPGKLGPRRIGCCPSSGRRGSDRRELRIPGRSVCGRTSLDRSAMEPTECLWAWGPISLPLIARYRPGPDCARQGAGGRLQPIEDPGGPVTPQRTRILGCRRHQQCAPGRHALERACLEPACAKSDGQAIGGDRRNGRPCRH